MNNKILPYLNIKTQLTAATIIVLLFISSVYDIYPVNVEITDTFGLASKLPLQYWIGYISLVSCLVILFFLEPKNKCVYILFLIIFGIYLFGVPIFAEENARFPWSYYPAGEVKQIMEKGYIDTFGVYNVMRYYYFPAIHIISAYIIYIPNSNIDSVIKFMPLFWILSILLISFGIGRKIRLSYDKTFAATIIVVSSFWIFHYYYGPQSLAYILYAVMFMITISYNKNVKNKILILLVFCSIVTMHLLTSIVTILSTLLVPNLNKDLYVKKHKLILIFISILITWYVYISPHMFNFGINELTGRVSNGIIINIAQDKYDPGSTLTRQVTHYARLTFPIIYLIILSSSFFILKKGSLSQENISKIKTIFMWLIGVGLLILFKYGSEIEDRIYIYSIIPIAFITVLSFSKKTIALIIFVLIIFHIPAHYGTESLDMVQTSELTGVSFLSSKLNNSKDSYLYYYLYVGYFSPDKLDWKRESFHPWKTPNYSIIDKTTFIIDSKQSYNQHIYDFGFSPTKIWIKENNEKINCLYNNKNFIIFKRNRI